mgnify:CR=1 FL=1
MKYNYKNKSDSKKFIHFSRKNIYDLVIIGSGPAGCTIAKELSNKYKILLIEEGQNFNPNLIKRRMILSEKIKIKKESLVVALGGASNTWGSGSSYFENFEMVDKKIKKNIWPITHNELLRLYKKISVKYNIKFPSNTKSYEKNSTIEREFLANSKIIKFEKLLNYEKIDVLFNVKVNQFYENKNKVTCVIIEKKKKIKIEAKKLILCCGTLENIKIIHNSFKRKRKKINFDMLGKYFMNHPKLSIGKIKFPKPEVNFNKYIFSGKNSYTGISLSQKNHNKNNLLNSFVRFSPIYKNIFKINFFNKILHKLSRLIKSNLFLDGYKILAFLEMSPSIKNNVMINKKNQIIVDYDFSKTDIQTLIELQKEIYSEFSSNSNNEKIIKINKNFIINKSIDASHHMGGTRYHPSSKSAFVDNNLKIIGLKNTYISSSSIFPTSGSANPTATIIALSYRLSSYLKNINFNN